MIREVTGMEEMDYTRKFSLGDQRDLEIKTILSTVYQALQEKGPVQQAAGPSHAPMGEGGLLQALFAKGSAHGAWPSRRGGCRRRQRGRRRKRPCGGSGKTHGKGPLREAAGKKKGAAWDRAPMPRL